MFHVITDDELLVKDTALYSLPPLPTFTNHDTTALYRYATELAKIIMNGTENSVCFLMQLLQAAVSTFQCLCYY